MDDLNVERLGQMAVGLRPKVGWKHTRERDLLMDRCTSKAGWKKRKNPRGRYANVVPLITISFGGQRGSSRVVGRGFDF